MKPIYFVGIALAVCLSIGAFVFYQNQNSYDLKSLGQNINNVDKEIVTSPVKQSSAFSLVEIAKHNSSTDCWTVVNAKVYDVTSFIPNHPGGEAIIPACGNDGTTLFHSVRDHARENAQVTLDNYLIGNLAKS